MAKLDDWERGGPPEICEYVGNPFASSLTGAEAAPFDAVEDL